MGKWAVDSKASAALLKGQSAEEQAQSAKFFEGMTLEFTSDGELFMLRVRGESMIGAGIFDGDFVVVRVQPTAELGDIVVAGIPGDEGTVKRLHAQSSLEIVLKPENPALELMVFTPDQVTIFGKVVTVMRKL